MSTAGGYAPIRLLIVTQMYPYGAGEPFLTPELHELNNLVSRLLIVPRSPSASLLHGDAAEFESQARKQSLVTGEILWRSLCIALRRPRRFLRVLRLLKGSRSMPILLKNLAVLPKGLWLGSVTIEEEIDHIHAHWAATTATMAMLASIMSDVPWSMTLHRWDITENNLLKEKSLSATFLRFISESGVRLASAQGVESTTAHVIHLGVPLPDCVEHNPGDRPLTILCPANLIEVKGHQYLIEAVSVLTGRGLAVRLVIAGQGPLESKLRKLTAKLGLEEQVTFTGQLSHDRLLRLYQDSEVDVVVLPSIDLGGGLHEGIPVSLMEAMSFGIPVVSTSTGGIPELVKPGAGIIVPPADSIALANAIAHLHGDQDRRRQIAENGLKVLRDSFSPKLNVALLHALVAAHTAPRGNQT